VEDPETKKKNKLEEFPEEYRSLVIMLGQDSSFAGSRDLARYVKGKVKPAVMSEDEQVVGTLSDRCGKTRECLVFILAPSPCRNRFDGVGQVDRGDVRSSVLWNHIGRYQGLVAG
jgi:hypothetical protein